MKSPSAGLSNVIVPLSRNTPPWGTEIELGGAVAEVAETGEAMMIRERSETKIIKMKVPYLQYLFNSSSSLSYQL